MTFEEFQTVSPDNYIYYVPRVGKPRLRRIQKGLVETALFFSDNRFGRNRQEFMITDNLNRFCLTHDDAIVELFKRRAAG